MRLRKRPSVLRLHKYGRHNVHKHMYSELLLYCPFRDEAEFEDCQASIDTCTEWYTNSNIVRVKEQIFPFKNTVEEARKLLEDAPIKRPGLVGDVIDPEFEMEGDEERAEGNVEDEEYGFRDPGVIPSDILPSAQAKETFIRIDISNKSAMQESARKLDREQRRVFDLNMAYCKNTRKAIANPKVPFPRPPLLKVHGGAGTGKSKLINDIATWAEFWLRCDSNRDPSHPHVVKCAPTGKAASVIEGLTLHKAFGFCFGDAHYSMSDETRSDVRTQLSELKTVILDEMSMIKSDQLYQLHLRLVEITQNEQNFGGISVMLFGDLMQLKPIGKWIFDKPKSSDYWDYHAISPLWEAFEPHQLITNHRQGDDRAYAELLNRLRVGLHTEEDIRLLKSRMVAREPDDALIVYGHRKKVAEKNIERVNKLPGTLHCLNATHFHKTIKNYKPIPDDDGTIKNTGFYDKLYLKVDAEVMIIFNLDTSDGLTNGASGIIRGFLKRNGAPAHETKDIHTILVELHGPERWGEKCRQTNAHILKQTPFKNCVPISRFSHDYSIGKEQKRHSSKATVIQFPLTLSWAITAHKCQGQTVKYPDKLAADIADMFGPGMVYVVLGRVQNINQLYLLSFDPQKIIISQAALDEATKIKDMSEQALEKDVFEHHWTKPGQGFDTIKKIAILNVRSLGNENGHIADVRADHTLLNADIICLTETWLPQFLAGPNIAGYKCYTASYGTGKGVAVYVREGIPIMNVEGAAKEAFQIIRIDFKDLILLAVYRSPSHNSAKDKTELIKRLSTIKDSSKPVVVCGDMNIPYNPSQPSDNLLSLNMIKNGFKQLVSYPTHIKGNILDHLYLRYPPDALIPPLHRLHYPYYSDHDAILLMLKKKA